MKENKHNCADANDNGEHDSSLEGEDDNMLTFALFIPGDDPATKSRMSEVEKRSSHAVATKNEHERVSAYWI